MSTHFIVEILCFFIRYFQCFSSSVPAFIIISICTHSHGSAKYLLHNSLSIHRYMLISTKIEFLGSLCSSDEIDLSVISLVTFCSCRLYFCLKNMSVILHVVSCHTCFYVYNTYRICNVKLFRKYDMCMLCESIVMYQCTCVFVHDMSYCNILYEYHMYQFVIFQQLTVMCYSVQYLFHMSCISF